MDKNELLSKTVFPIGDPLPESLSQYFIGQGYIISLTTDDTPAGCRVSNVTFEPGCRNNWHTHGVGQVLAVTAGTGWYQQEGQPAQKLQAGDTVEIPAGTKHWHGASKDSWFAHLSIQPVLDSGSYGWAEPVSDEEYAMLS